MFSLILVLVGLVLVAAIAIATIYYGGEAASEGSANAEASALLAQVAQIASASAAYTADHDGIRPTTLEQLVSKNYLSSIPPGWEEPTADGEVPITSKVIDSLSACQLFNKKQGVFDETQEDGVPLCDEITSLTNPVCCK